MAALLFSRIFLSVWVSDAVSISGWQLPATQMTDCLSHCLLSNIFAANLLPIWGDMLVCKEHFPQTFLKKNTGFLPPPSICTLFPLGTWICHPGEIDFFFFFFYFKTFELVLLNTNSWEWENSKTCLMLTFKFENLKIMKF